MLAAHGADGYVLSNTYHVILAAHQDVAILTLPDFFQNFGDPSEHCIYME